MKHYNIIYSQKHSCKNGVMAGSIIGKENEYLSSDLKISGLGSKCDLYILNWYIKLLYMHLTQHCTL